MSEKLDFPDDWEGTYNVAFKKRLSRMICLRRVECDPFTQMCIHTGRKKVVWKCYPKRKSPWTKFWDQTVPKFCPRGIILPKWCGQIRLVTNNWKWISSQHSSDLNFRKDKISSLFTNLYSSHVTTYLSHLTSLVIL